MSRGPLAFNRMTGRGYVWRGPAPDYRQHRGAWYSGGNGSYLLDCDTCGLQTAARRWGADERVIERQFDRAHRIDSERGYRGRHRGAPVPARSAVAM